MSHLPSAAIVTPVGNEAKSIESFCQSLYDDVFQVIPNKVVWIPVIDDYSTDGTLEILQRLADGNSRIVLRHIGKGRGIAAAYLSGFQEAVYRGFDNVIEMDVGHPTHLVPLMLACLASNPVVWGTRRNGGESINTSIFRRALSWSGTFLSHRLLGLTMSDCTSGFEGFQAAVVERIVAHDFLSSGHMFQTEVKRLCANLSFQEIPFVYSGGESSLRWKSIVEAVSVLFRLRKVKPMEIGR